MKGVAVKLGSQATPTIYVIITKDPKGWLGVIQLPIFKPTLFAKQTKRIPNLQIYYDAKKTSTREEIII